MFLARSEAHLTWALGFGRASGLCGGVDNGQISRACHFMRGPSELWSIVVGMVWASVKKAVR